ncbi:cell division protein FtsL [Thalassolituus hydrocarboniclasticus]|uniref:Cell division protein FtsL n=1 Tax=Thalassolituus hydrocarboniclasticus TaxID=2742796 RepID=A0ABY6A971_9GAMM|nr:cell division protein FtsL [Thalassolituus hydrocarboniclasticus]UXD86786.1 cell division protein FtsL [Thalassolituus hydrocarboniclasticus]
MNAGVAILWGVVLVSALAQVGVVHWHRTLLQVWQQEDALRAQLLQEHTRLLLEKSTLTAHGRIDQQARKQLNMTEPGKVQVLSR